MLTNVSYRPVNQADRVVDETEERIGVARRGKKRVHNSQRVQRLPGRSNDLIVADAYRSRRISDTESFGPFTALLTRFPSTVHSCLLVRLHPTYPRHVRSRRPARWRRGFRRLK